MSRQRQRRDPRRAGVAGFWRRALAASTDAVLIAIVAVAAEAGYLAAQGIPPRAWRIDPSDPAQPIALATVLIVAALYDVVLTRRLGGTVGKRMLGLRVESREGGPPGVGQLVGRLFGRVISALPVLLGFLWALWDRRKQTWHDKLADTVVLRDGDPRPAPVAHDEDTGDIALPGDLAQAAMLVAEPAHEQQAAPPAGSASSATDTGAWTAAAQPEPEPQPQPTAQPPQPQPMAQPAQPQPTAFAPQPGYGAPAPQPGYGTPPQPAYTAAAPPAWQPQPAPQPQPAWGAPNLAPPPPAAPRNDPNGVAIGRAGLGQDAAAWLQQVADQVDARLDRVSGTWRTSPHAEAARACAFGLLLGHLARLYPHMRPELNATAELHPSFSTLMEGARLATLEQIVAEPGRIAAWLGPLIDVQDPERLRTLLD